VRWGRKKRKRVGNYGTIEKRAATRTRTSVAVPALSELPALEGPGLDVGALAADPDIVLATPPAADAPACNRGNIHCQDLDHGKGKRERETRTVLLLLVLAFAR
jgi:hypothetical protein